MATPDLVGRGDRRRDRGLVIGFYLLQVNTLSSVNADIEDAATTNESINAQIAVEAEVRRPSRPRRSEGQKLCARVRG